MRETAVTALRHTPVLTVFCRVFRYIAHFTGGGIDGVLDLIVEDYFAYLDRAVEIYEKEITTPRRVVLSGIEKR